MSSARTFILFCAILASGATALPHRLQKSRLPAAGAEMRFAACKTVAQLLTDATDWGKFADLLKTWQQDKPLPCLGAILAYQSFSPSSDDVKIERFAMGVRIMTNCICNGNNGLGLDENVVSGLATTTKFSCSSPLKTIDDYISNFGEDYVALKFTTVVSGVEIFPATAFDTTKTTILTNLQNLLGDGNRKAAFKAAFGNCDMAFAEERAVLTHTSATRTTHQQMTVPPSSTTLLSWPQGGAAPAAAAVGRKVYAWRYVAAGGVAVPGGGFTAAHWKFGQTSGAFDNGGWVNKVMRYGLTGARAYVEWVFVDNVPMNQVELCMFSHGCTNGAGAAATCASWTPMPAVSNEFWTMPGADGLWEATVALCGCAGGGGGVTIQAGRAEINAPGWVFGMIGGNPSVFAPNGGGAGHVIVVGGGPHNCAAGGGGLGAYGVNGFGAALAAAGL